MWYLPSQAQALVSARRMLLLQSLLSRWTLSGLNKGGLSDQQFGFGKGGKSELEEKGEDSNLTRSELIYPRNVPPGSRSEVPKPSQFGIDASECEELSIATPDGETLHAYLVKPANKSQARPITILSFHGNAGNVGHRLPIAHVLARDLQCTTMLLEYRGYGLSTGNPNEKGLAVDAQAGLDYLRQREDLKGNRIVVYGQSLGGAVSIDLVGKNAGTGDIHGLILENTFLSMAKMIPTILPMGRLLTPLCHEHWRSEAMIGRITDVPILFLSGLKDEIVPSPGRNRLSGKSFPVEITTAQLRSRATLVILISLSRTLYPRHPCHINMEKLFANNTMCMTSSMLPVAPAAVIISGMTFSADQKGLGRLPISTDAAPETAGSSTVVVRTYLRVLVRIHPTGVLQRVFLQGSVSGWIDQYEDYTAESC
nr:protein bem46 [Quercus suber]